MLSAILQRGRGAYALCFTIYIFVIKIVYTVIFWCWSILYTQHLLHACSSWERDPSSVALSEVSSISLLKGFILGRFSLSYSRV